VAKTSSKDSKEKINHWVHGETREKECGKREQKERDHQVGKVIGIKFSFLKPLLQVLVGKKVINKN
jgi:hypothetical protein